MTSLRLTGVWSPLLVVGLAAMLSLVSGWSYRRRLLQAHVGASAWTLPCLRAAAIFFITMTLAEPTLQWQALEGKLARVHFLLDASQSMSVDTSASKSQPNGFARAVESLVAEHGLLANLKNNFEIEVARFDSGAITSLWHSRQPQPEALEAYDQWSPASWSQQSSLGDALQWATRDYAVDSSHDIIVLLSDGQSNSGPNPVESAADIAKLGVKLFTIGFGPTDDYPDLALRKLTTPARLDRTDTLLGTITLEQHRSQGKKITLQIEYAHEIIWKKTIIGTQEPVRNIDFSMPALDLANRATNQLPAGTQTANLPIKLTASVSVEGGEINEYNNAQACHFEFASHQSRVLLLDGRSRWEARYLKNMYARDPAWQLDDALQLTATGQLPFVDSLEDLLQVDLIVLGDVDPLSLPSQMPEWIRQFVELSGGGLIVIDGARQNLRAQQFAPLHAMLPIAWLDSTDRQSHKVRDALPKTPQLTEQGRALAALQLGTRNAEEDTDLWSRLAPLEFIARVEPLPGSEVLLEASSQVDQFPLLVTRRYGAGRVLYSASDETWRWRYQTAESLHSRLWLQLSRWVMKSPMSLTAEFVSLDAGAGSYLPGQPIDLRCELRGRDGQVASGVAPMAVITRLGHVVARVPMQEEAIAGTYGAQTSSLPTGDYEVQIAAPDFSSAALELKARFSVEPLSDQEYQRLSCNRELLQSMSEKAAGAYLNETQLEQLPELLQPFRQGRNHSQSILLWQSYGWFTATMLLLIAEWIIRKRVGLV